MIMMIIIEVKGRGGGGGRGGDEGMMSREAVGVLVGMNGEGGL